MAVSAPETSTNRKPLRPQLVALVVNARAGGLLEQDFSPSQLEERLHALADTVRVVPPEAGTLPERIGLAMEMGADCLVVAGGDGTVACAAAALAGSERRLGVIPCGTMNLLAKDLGIDPADPEHALGVLADGRVRSIDVGRVEGEVFLCASMLGTPARLSRHREAGRARGNGILEWAGFGWATLRALARNRSLRCVLRLDGQAMPVRSPSITITVNRLDDSSGRLFGRSDLSGGDLAVYVVRRSSALRQVLVLLRTVLTGRLREPEIEVFTAREVVVEAPDPALHVLVDGELRLLKPPLHYSIVPGALRVIARG